MHIMVDLETLGLSADAKVISLGLVKFDAHRIIDTLYIKLDYARQYGRTSEQQVLDWWERQSIDAKAVLSPVGALPNLQGLQQVHDFMYADGARPCIWGNGVDFDNVILNHIFTEYGLAGLDYRNNRCYRTINAMFPLPPDVRPVRVGVAHHALDDALYQARTLQAISHHYGVVL